ncbi:hypothetical protein Acr_04g0001630 [Actinidia rufa]|uniref:Uncharacterized protein n=1 Tax=Actinidia rufa TaxID=165716 RepID=A0A7J0EG36_9ERIC|nr:hypothetical protein Acr_04g0001630 [Actinidia rufa]
MPRLRALFPSHKNERRKTRGRTKTLVPPAKGIARLARARSSTPPPPQFLPLTFGTSSYQLGSSAIASPMTTPRGISRHSFVVAQISVVNYQRKKKFSNDLKKTQTKATILKNELRKRDEELVATVEEPGEFYVHDEDKDRVKAFHEGFDEEEYFNHPAKVDDNTQASATEVEAKKEIKKEANRSNLL